MVVFQITHLHNSESNIRHVRNCPKPRKSTEAHQVRPSGTRYQARKTTTKLQRVLYKKYLGLQETAFKIRMLR